MCVKKVDNHTNGNGVTTKPEKKYKRSKQPKRLYKKEKNEKERKGV